MSGNGQSKMGVPGGAGRWPTRWALLLLSASLAGCVNDRAAVGKNLLTEMPTAEERITVARGYRVCCPDVVEVRVITRPDLHWTAAVDVDGSYPVESLGRPRFEGRGVDDIVRLVADRLGVSQQDVVAEVTEYRSKRVYVFGQVKDAPQAVPYRGPETVTELLQRVGGLTAGAEPTEVYVARSNIGDGKRPEVFRVDLRAILLKKDNSTNVRLEPFDQVHVGETPQALVERCIPPWMRAFHWAVWDTRPDDRPPAAHFGQRLHEAQPSFAERRTED